MYPVFEKKIIYAKVMRADFIYKNIYRVDTMERIDCMLICCMSHATITKLKRTSAKSKNNNGHLENILSILYLINLLMKDTTLIYSL